MERHTREETPLVSVTGSRGGYENTKSALAGLDLGLIAGKSVFIKPNAGRVVPPNSGVNTSPEAVAGCADAMLEAGAARVAVGESPILGVKTITAFESCGIATVVRERGLELIDLDKDPPVMLDLPEGSALPRVKLCSRVHEFDVLVSLAVAKTHMHTDVTLSLKNMKGILYRREKVKFHQLPGQRGESGAKPLDVAICDFLRAIRPDIGVIDGAVGLEGLGPSAGNPKPFDAAVASRDPVAADAVACRLMGIDPLSVPHIRLIAEHGVGEADLSRIRTTPADYERFASPFARPPMNLSLAFPDVEVYDAGTCSACMSTTMLFLQRFADKIRDYQLKDGKLHLVIGKDVADVPAGTIVIGNCAAKHKNRGPFAKGCPPVASKIYRAVMGREPDEAVP